MATVERDEFRGLEWCERYQIIMGICEGLHHLHKDKHILHMDLKPDNILLGGHLVPKITDFGLARPDEKSQTTSEQRRLTLGYCDPEYLHKGRMSAKSDIYSLGVIILELVTGSKADPNITNVLRRWRHRWNKSSEHTPLMWYEQVSKCLDLAQRCKRENPIDRPDIGDVIRELSEIDTWNGQISCATVSTVREIMSSLEDMLEIEPLEMHIPFAPNEQISFSIKMTNDTNDYFAFRIATSSLLPFSAHPEKGIVPPGSNLCATIILKAQEKALLQNRCNVFIVQSSRIDGIPIPMEVTKYMFVERVGTVVDEVNVTVVFDMPPTTEQPQTTIAGIQWIEADKAYRQMLRRTIKESLETSVQVYQGSSEFTASTVSGYSRVKRWTAKFQVLDTSLGTTPDDGFMWGKYGQKVVHGGSFPRSYYKCAYSHPEGCKAKRLVQRSDTDLCVFDITYIGVHTCHQKENRTAYPPIGQPPPQDPGLSDCLKVETTEAPLDASSRDQDHGGAGSTPVVSPSTHWLLSPQSH